MIPVDALLFDLDGTLIDSQKDLARSVRALQTFYEHAPSRDDEVARFIGDGVVKLVQRALPSFRDERLDEAVHRFKLFYHRHCLDHTRLMPGARRILNRYRGKRLAIVTNKPERVSRRILAGLGVAEQFDLVLGGDSLRLKKPDPWPVQAALQRLGRIHPRRAVMVGDGINDILAGRAAGVWTCGLRSTISQLWTKPHERPDFELLNLAELMRIFN